MLPASERLTRRRDFSAVYARKKSWAGPLLVLYVRRAEVSSPEANSEEVVTRRFGYSVSKKVGKAHDRNRVKRRLREICRLHGAEIARGFDVVFVARTASSEASYTDLEAAVLLLLKRAGLLLRGV